MLTIKHSLALLCIALNSCALVFANTELSEIPRASFKSLPRDIQEQIIRTEVLKLKSQHRDFTHIIVENEDIMPFLWATDTGQLFKWLLEQGADTRYLLSRHRNDAFDTIDKKRLLGCDSSN